MKLRWYVNRLRSMQSAEIAHRVVEKARKTISRRDRRGWQAYPPVPMKAVFPALQARVAGATVVQREAIAVAADDILAGKFSALGRAWPQRSTENLFPDDLWSLDPVTGERWPGSNAYTFDVDYRHNGARGDIKYAWEIGRLQFLPVLAMHLLLSEDDRAARAIEAAIESWHRANPPFTGIGWSSGIEVALRAISVVTTRDLVGDRLSAETLRRMAQILSASLYWLKRFPSRYSSANNHLVAELAGEYLIGLSLGQAVEEVGKELADELLKQIFADGCGAEQTPTYAAFTIELVLFCIAASRQQGRAFDEKVGERMKAFARFAAWLPRKMTFGDDDEGRVLTLGNEGDYVGSVAAAVAGFFEVPAVSTAERDIRALFFGTSAKVAQQPSGLHVFRDGGVSIWRGKAANRDIELLFDHGPLGYLSIAAHGHADALSLCLSVDGHPVLVDPGTWLYGSGGIWRDWFRSTMAHNTLSIAGESQSVMSGAFNWSHKASVELIKHAPGEDWSLTAEHAGYQRRFGVKHRRRLRYDDGRIIVTDWLLGASRPADIVFQLAPDLTVDIEGTELRVGKDGMPLLTLSFPAGDISVASGGDLPGGGGWVSPRFGVRVPAPRIIWHGAVGPDGVDIVLAPAARS
ncbi:heparinase II/III family protein [Rhizobium panacihumi]|uniref:heparinase II/III family protein n=1 Tax=Rhizobium panacihumi TaxID=2008450 RepID=UPI003D79C009